MFKKIFNDRFKLLLTISFRNLIRQKRRNMLLGIAIAIGMMVLIMSNSWARGITDILLNKLLVYAFGHIQVTMTERGNYQQDIVRDRDRLIKAIRENVTGIIQINENAATFTRLIGKGKAEAVALVGIDKQRFTNDGFSGMVAISGKMSDFTNSAIENPILIYEDKAKLLNVKVGDTLRARMVTIYGRQQTARFQVVVILKSIGFMQSMASYVPLDNMKILLEYQPWESGALQVILKNPKSGIKQANKLHQALHAGPAVISGTLSSGGGATPVDVLAFYKRPDVAEKVTVPFSPFAAMKTMKPGVTNLPFVTAGSNGVRTSGIKIVTNELKVVSGRMVSITNETAIAIGTALATKLGVAPGAAVTLSYSNKFGGVRTTKPYKVVAVFDAGGKLPLTAALFYEKTMNAIWFENQPLSAGTKKDIVATNTPIYKALEKEWLLLRRSPTMDDMTKKFKVMTKVKWKSAALDVSTMFETFNQIVIMEGTIFLITTIMVLMLFLVILVGVVNTLNMTIRERTREIGTVRSIGMQKNDVRDTFLLETLMLSLAACVAGTAAGFLLMGILALIPIHTTSMFSMFLDEGHIHFVPSIFSVIGFLVVICGMTVLTALVPSKRAANIPAAAALRHYE